MQWTKVVPIKHVNNEKVINFLKHNIITRFGILTSHFFDNETLFSALKLYDFSLENGIVLKNLANYYPHGNDLVELTNKNLICIIKNIMYYEQRNWNNALVNVLWAYCVIPKSSLRTSPYLLVYGKEAILPPNIYLPTLQISQESWGKPCLLVQSRINTPLKP